MSSTQGGAPAIKAPAAPVGQKPLHINLPTALQLANAQAIDIQVASQRIEVAAAQLQRAQSLWLPTIYLGTDYYRHDGQIQETPGPVFWLTGSSAGSQGARCSRPVATGAPNPR